MQFGCQDNGFGLPRVQCSLDEVQRRVVSDLSHLHPRCTGILDSLCGCVGLLGNLLSNCLRDTHLSSFVT